MKKKRQKKYEKLVETRMKRTQWTTTATTVIYQLINLLFGKWNEKQQLLSTPPLIL